MVKTDLTLHEDVLEALAFDPKVPADGIATAVHDGIVTLRGTVPSLIAKWAAENAVKQVHGVQGIAEELEVELRGDHQRTDQDILTTIQQRIAWDVFMPRNVVVVVEKGNVTATGQADWHFEIDELANSIRRLKGVKSFRNLVTLKERPIPTLEDIKQKIRSEFARTAGVDASRVHVTADVGTVTLKGFVRSWFEREMATQAAWGVPGVLTVRNELIISN